MYCNPLLSKNLYNKTATRDDFAKVTSACFTNIYSTVLLYNKPLEMLFVTSNESIPLMSSTSILSHLLFIVKQTFVA